MNILEGFTPVSLGEILGRRSARNHLKLAASRTCDMVRIMVGKMAFVFKNEPDFNFGVLEDTKKMILANKRDEQVYDRFTIYQLLDGGFVAVERHPFNREAFVGPIYPYARPDDRLDVTICLLRTAMHNCVQQGHIQLIDYAKFMMTLHAVIREHGIFVVPFLMSPDSEMYLMTDGSVVKISKINKVHFK